MPLFLEELTESNYKELAEKMAYEFFPKGTLVNWHYAGFIHFGLVQSISKTGKITVKTGKLPLEKTTDVSHGGIYAKHWYRANVEEFEPFTDDYLSRSAQTATTRFNPEYYKGNDWKEKNICPIVWLNAKGALEKPIVTIDNLIMEEHYSP